MSGRSLQVKAVLLKEGVEDGLKEIRRFRVDEEEVGGVGDRQLLQTLLTRVQSVFSVDTSSQKCTLFWKDEDGDLIQFSSEEELRHAVDNMSDGILRIFVTVTGRTDEGSATQGPEKNAHHGDYVPPHASFYVPPPPPPPPPHHSHAPPPPFCGPWTQFGWKKCKPMGPGGWKGGWKGGMFYGCPWAMGHEGNGCGRKGRGFFKHCWDKKMKKMMKTMRWNMTATSQQNEFNEVRKQVPAKFRTWVRQYVHAWYTQGPEAAQNANTDKLPEGVGHDFPQWLPSFLNGHFSHPKSSREWDEEMRDTGKDGQMGNAPDCLPPVYYRWLCLFLPRFFARNGHMNTSDCEEDESFLYPGGHCHAFKQGFYARRGFGCPGKHGSFKKNKGGKHKRCNSSSESDSDGGQKAWRKVPKGLRKFVRMSFKQLRKGKGDKSKIREKASRAGVSKEVQEFVEQVMLEWNGKLSCQPHHVVAKEMMKGERTLPSGMQREHFQWMVRFMARWDAGKCRFMPGWLGGDSATDESSGEEATPEGPDCGACPPYTPSVGSMPAPPFMGMPGAPPHGFGMYPGMDHPFAPPPPPPPPMYGCFPPPPPPPTGFPPAYVFECPEQGAKNDKPEDGKGYKVDISDSETSSSSTDDMDHVTEGVKKM